MNSFSYIFSHGENGKAFDQDQGGGDKSLALPRIFTIN
jgi:hypothetical protein